MPLRLLLILFLASFALRADEPSPFDRARVLFENNRFDEARAAFDHLAASDANNPELLYWQGMCAVALNHADEAVTRLERATALKPDDARFFDALGDAYGMSALKASLFAKLGLARKCIASYDRAVALDPANVEYRKSRYEYYRSAPAMAGGGADKAAAEIAEIEKLDPVQGAGLRADLKLKDGHVDEAFALLEQLRHKYPDSPVLRFQLGRLSALTGQHLDEGETALAGYLGYTPKPSDPPLWAAQWRLAQVLEKEGKIQLARTHYQECLKLNPAFDRAREALKKLP